MDITGEGAYKLYIRIEIRHLVKERTKQKIGRPIDLILFQPYFVGIKEKWSVVSGHVKIMKLTTQQQMHFQNLTATPTTIRAGLAAGCIYSG